MGHGHALYSGGNSQQKSATYRIEKLDGQELVVHNAVRMSAKHKSDNKKLFIQVRSISNRYSAIYPVEFVDALSEDVVQISKPVRNAFGCALGSTQNIKFVYASDAAFKKAAHIKFDIQLCFPDSNKQRTLAFSVIRDYLLKHGSEYAFSPGQIIVVPYENNLHVQLRVTEVDGIANISDAQQQVRNLAHLDIHTKIDIAVASTATPIQLYEDAQQRMLSLDFAAQGVGGHKKQLAQMVREGFHSRVMPAEFAKLYGVKHTKGILLYGPPGTGKTLIARVIGNMFTKDKVKVVNGAELKNKYVGQSTENLRSVFHDAMQDWKLHGDKSELHVIIFDEIDAMCPTRGARHGTGVDEDMVAQLLTLLDGVDSPQNVLVIGMTNRKDLIDSALLRPGRLEVHIEIGLPGQDERLEILKIKTAHMVRSNLIADDVQLDEWARKTVNYTGAEIEQLVKKSVFYAMGSNFNDEDIETLTMKAEIKNRDQLAKVDKSHFAQAFSDIRPAFGIDATLDSAGKEDFVIYNDTLANSINNFSHDLTVLNGDHGIHAMGYIISGDAGTGKTKLAIHLAQQTGAKYIKLIAADKIFSLPPYQQYAYLDDVFADLKRVEHSALIMDGIEDLLGADAELRNYNNGLRLKFEAHLHDLSESSAKCIFFATTKSTHFIERVGLSHLFNEVIELDKITLKKDNVLAVFGKLCEPLGIQVEGDIAKLKTTSTLTIRDLMYRIKKYCAGHDTSQLDVVSFMATLTPDKTQSVTAAGLFHGKGSSSRAMLLRPHTAPLNVAFLNPNKINQ